MTSPNHSAVADADNEASHATVWKPSTTCFSCTRLNPTTFLIVEDDQWSEMPFIYAKICPSVLVLVDTGCGGAAKDPSVKLTSLREFLETFPVADNNGLPLNPNGMKDYAVVCTHCHYDHIGRPLFSFFFFSFFPSHVLTFQDEEDLLARPPNPEDFELTFSCTAT